jgi:protein O-mannosyl-transferase
MEQAFLKYINIKNILVLAVITHLPMLWNQFTFYSDDNYVLTNNLVHGINLHSIEALFTTYFDGHYHPLTLLSLAFTYLFSGSNALGYQLTNLCFHILSCYLLYKALSEFKFAGTVVLITTLVFAIHPLNTESVCRITERKDTQYVLFLMIALYNYARYYNAGVLKYYVISVICFFLALLSKGQALVFPAILYSIEWYFNRTKQKAFHHAAIAPLFLLSFLFVYLNYRAQVVTGYLSETEAITATQVFTYPSYIISHYIIKLFFPVFLSAQYPAPAKDAWMWGYPLVALCLPVLLVWLYRKKHDLALLGCLLYIVSVFPMLRLVPVSENFMPDRYNYLGLVGFGMVIASVCVHFSKTKALPKQSLMLWLLIIGSLCVARTTVWKTGLTVWGDAWKKNPEDACATVNYGAVLSMAPGTQQQGMDLYKKGVEMDAGQLIRRINYAGALRSVGRQDDYISELKTIVSYQAKGADNMVNKGAVLLSLGYPEQARVEFDKAIRLKPGFAKNRVNRAGFYYSQFRFNDALNELDTLEALHSNYLGILWFLRADIYIAENNIFKAQEAIEQARQIFADKNKIGALKDQVSALQGLPFPENFQQMGKEKLVAAGKKFYENKLFMQSYVLFNCALQKSPGDEKLLNNMMAAAFSLSRPDLVRLYLQQLEKYHYPADQNAINYLHGLGADLSF